MKAALGLAILAAEAALRALRRIGNALTGWTEREPPQ